MNKGDKVTIRVTKTDIRNGIRMDGAKCPIALAAQRVTGMEMRMGASLLYSTDYNFNTVVPEKIQKWINQFDIGQGVKPVQFTVVLGEW